MYKNIKKITMLLFVAATMLTAAACNKDDDNNDGGSSSSISESQLYGTWHFENASYYYSDMTITTDHKCIIRDYTYTWTLKGNKLSGSYTYYSDDYERTITEYIEFVVKSVTDDTMVIEGKRTYVDGSSGAWSGILHKVTK